MIITPGQRKSFFKWGTYSTRKPARIELTYGEGETVTLYTARVEASYYDFVINGEWLVEENLPASAEMYIGDELIRTETFEVAPTSGGGPADDPRVDQILALNQAGVSIDPANYVYGTAKLVPTSTDPSSPDLSVAFVAAQGYMYGASGRTAAISANKKITNVSGDGLGKTLEYKNLAYETPVFLHASNVGDYVTIVNSTNLNQPCTLLIDNNWQKINFAGAKVYSEWTSGPALITLFNDKAIVKGVGTEVPQTNTPGTEILDVATDLPAIAAQATTWGKKIKFGPVVNKDGGGQQVILGYGDFDTNTGPVNIYGVDVDTGDVEVLLANFNTEEIINIREMSDGSIWIPAVDPKVNESAEIATNFGGTWHTIEVAIPGKNTPDHLFDVAVTADGKIHVCGSRTMAPGEDEQYFPGFGGFGGTLAISWVSDDGGDTWEEELIGHAQYGFPDGFTRFHSYAMVGDNLICPPSSQNDSKWYILESGADEWVESSQSDGSNGTSEAYYVGTYNWNSYNNIGDRNPETYEFLPGFTSGSKYKSNDFFVFKPSGPGKPKPTVTVRTGVWTESTGSVSVTDKSVYFGNVTDLNGSFSGQDTLTYFVMKPSGVFVVLTPYGAVAPLWASPKENTGNGVSVPFKWTIKPYVDANNSVKVLITDSTKIWSIGPIYTGGSVANADAMGLYDGNYLGG